MSHLLHQSRLAFGPAPRVVTTRDNLAPPPWMKSDDPLQASYARLGALLTDGDVIWGHVVQANVALFRSGEETAPAQIAYGARSDREVRPERLREIAKAAYALKGAALEDPALARVSSALARELERHEPIDLPGAITRGAAVRMAIVVVHRALLPKRRLSSSFVPLLANRARDEIALLPGRHWSEDLKRGWLGLGACD